MKKFKILLLSLVVLVLIQFLSYSFYGKYSLPYKHFDQIENYHYTKGIIGVFYEKGLTEFQKSEIEKRLLKRYRKVEFAALYEDYYENYRIRDEEKTMGLLFLIDYSFPFKAVIFEEQGYLYYGESWESKYIWCFFKWIRLERVCTSQS